MANRFEVLKSEKVDLQGKEIKVLSGYRGEPAPKDPARIDKNQSTESMSADELAKVLTER